MGGERFGRFNEEAKRALLFTRAAISRFGGSTIESEHLAWGVIHAVPQVFERFMAQEWSVDRIRDRLTEVMQRGPMVADSVEIPFTPAVDHALREAIQIADRLGRSDVRAEHLLLALLADEASTCGQLLRGAGLNHERIVAYLIEHTA